MSEVRFGSSLQSGEDDWRRIRSRTNILFVSIMWQVTRVLIVCPVSTILNWENEFKIWLPGGTMKLMAPGGGVMKIGYEMFRGLANQKNNPSGPNLFTRCLVEAGHSLRSSFS